MRKFIFGVLLFLSCTASAIITGTVPIHNHSSAVTGGVCCLTTTNNNILGADIVGLASGIYTDGASLSLGSGKWYICGHLVLQTNGSTAIPRYKLWDGTTVIASSADFAGLTTGGNNNATLCGFITNPVGNVRISVWPGGSPFTIIKASASGEGKDTMVQAWRVQ